MALTAMKSNPGRSKNVNTIFFASKDPSFAYLAPSGITSHHIAIGWFRVKSKCCSSSPPRCPLPRPANSIDPKYRFGRQNKPYCYHHRHFQRLCHRLPPIVAYFSYYTGYTDRSALRRLPLGRPPLAPYLLSSFKEGKLCAAAPMIPLA